MNNKTRLFRQLLKNDNLEFLCEAHNGLSAKIVEEAGFKGIWASGLTMSAAMGVRDNNEASWTQVLEVLEFMSDNTNIPIMVDGDTGYGNFNNMRRLVKKLEQRNIAAVCIEDKIFPKTNSFIQGETQNLADIDEFCGKIQAGKDARLDENFSIIARTESFIVGLGAEEALKRANAYSQAGADAILVHSKQSDARDIIEFMKSWHRKCPVVIVPTTYSSTPTQVFKDLKISMVIWANHILRASVSTMQKAAKMLLAEKSAQLLEKKIITVPEIFRLQNAQELKLAEKKYLPQKPSTRAIILAASRGENFGKLTEDKPKAMISVKGEPIIKKLVSILRKNGIRNINVVTGYKNEAFDINNIQYFHNSNFEKSGEIGSLIQALEALDEEVIISYGDIIFKDYILSNLLETPSDISIVVDDSKNFHCSKKKCDKVIVNKERTSLYNEEPYHLVDISPQLPNEESHGEWIGLIKLNVQGCEIIKKGMEKMRTDNPDYYRLSLTDLLQTITKENLSEIGVQYIHGDWLDIDDLEDLSQSYLF